MTSVYPSPMYGGGQPPIGTYPAYGNQPPASYDPQQPPPNGYYAPPPGTAPPQGYYAQAPGYYAPQGNPPAAGYYAPPGGAPSPGYGAPAPQYAPPPGAAWVDPATAGYSQPPNASYQSPYGNGVAVAIPIAQPVYGAPPSKEAHDPANRIEMGRWSEGLCDCCNHCMPNLCMSWCCPCIALAQVYARIALGRYAIVLARLLVLTIGGLVLRFGMPASSTTQTGTWDENGNYVPGSPSMASTAGSVGYVVIQLAFVLHVVYARTRVRERFQIPGNGCCDCLIGCCCSCCAIAQMATHVKSYKPGDCSFDAPDVLPPFH